MAIDDKKLDELWELSKRDDFFDFIVPSTVRELIGELRKTKEQPVELTHPRLTVNDITDIYEALNREVSKDVILKLADLLEPYLQRQPKRESGEADSILELFQEAQIAFDHGDDVTQMLRFGEATELMNAYLERRRWGPDV